MIKNDYTTTNRKNEILSDDKVIQELKDLESEKIVLSEEAFAICTLLEQVKLSLDKFRMPRI